MSRDHAVLHQDPLASAFTDRGTDSAIGHCVLAQKIQKLWKLELLLDIQVAFKSGIALQQARSQQIISPFNFGQHLAHD